MTTVRRRLVTDNDYVPEDIVADVVFTEREIFYKLDDTIDNLKYILNHYLNHEDKERKITKSMVARKLDVSRRNVNHWLAGIRKPNTIHTLEINAWAWALREEHKQRQQSSPASVRSS